MASTPLYKPEYRPSVKEREASTELGADDRGDAVPRGFPPGASSSPPYSGFCSARSALPSFSGGVLRRAGREGPASGNGLADDEGVHVVGALVRVDAFEVCHVLHHAVVEQDAVSAQDVTSEGGRLPGLCYVVHLEHRDGRRREVASVFKTAHVDREQLRERDLINHLDELCLHELEGGYLLAELLAFLCVGECRLVAVHRLSEAVPTYPVARVRQHGEGGAQAVRLGEASLAGDVAVAERYVGLPGGPLRALAGQNLGVVARVVALDKKAGDPLVLRARPDHGSVRERGVTDPPLLPVKDVAAALLDGGRRKGAGVASSLRLGKAEAAYFLAPRHRGEPLLLLLLRAEVVDRRHRQAALDV